MNPSNRQSRSSLARTLAGARRLVLGSALALSVLSGMVPARPTLAQANPAVAFPQGEAFRIGVDDELIIASPSHMEANQTVIVLPDGTIQVAGVNRSIRVVGMTTEEIRTEVFRELDKLYANLQLTVAVKTVRSRRVVINGTRTGGAYPLLKDMRVSDLIAMGGGLQFKVKQTFGTLTRGGKVRKLDMAKLLGKDPDPAADFLLETGDTVTIFTDEEAAPPTYSVTGAVSKSGAFPMPLDGSPVSLARAVAEAGGRTQYAALKEVVLIRKKQRIPLNLYPFLVEGKADAEGSNINMEDGDVLLIPELLARYTVVGAVGRAAMYPLPEARTLNIVQAIAEAGGQTPQSELREVVLSRNVEGKTVSQKLNVLNLMKTPDKADAVIIQNGDVIYLPQRGEKTTLRDAGNILGAVLNPFWMVSNIFR